MPSFAVFLAMTFSHVEPRRVTMKKWLVAGAVAMTLLTGVSESQAQSNVIGNGLLGAGVGAAIGGIAGGGRGAATGAIIGGTVGAVTGAFRPSPGYAYPAGCHWIPGHHNSYGEWRPGHCAHY